MFKWFCLIILGVQTPSFSENIISNTQEVDLHTESLALVHVGSGNDNLLSNNYVSALDDFERASSLLKKSENPCDELKFLIFFGKTIAYDNLGLKDECHNALVSLLLILNDGEDIDDSGFNYLEEAPREYKEADEIMKRLAMLAPTSNVRSLLFSLVDEMSEHLLPLFQIANPASFEQTNWKCR